MTGKLALALLLLAPLPAAAEPGRTAAAFLQRGLGAQSAGMAGAFCAIVDSAESMQYNPAGLATLRARTATSTYLRGLGRTNYGYLGYAHPSRYGTFAAGALYHNAGSIDLNLSDGTRGTVTAEEDAAVNLSYAYQLLPGFSAGATYRYLRMELAETAKASSSQGDFGVLWRTPLKGVSAGAAYQYLGPDITFESVGDPPPKTFRYGIALRFPDIGAKSLDPSVDLEKFDMTLAADVAQTLHEKASPRVGGEFGLTPGMALRVALRFGWVFARDSESFTFGFGIKQGRFGLDYGIGLADELNNLQQVSLTYRF